MGVAVAQIDTVQAILEELKRREKPKQWLADKVADHIAETTDRPRPNPKTILRMLRGDTEGGVYLIDHCLIVLELKIVRCDDPEGESDGDNCGASDDSAD